MDSRLVSQCSIEGGERNSEASIDRSFPDLTEKIRGLNFRARSEVRVEIKVPGSESDSAYVEIPEWFKRHIDVWSQEEISLRKELR